MAASKCRSGNPHRGHCVRLPANAAEARKYLILRATAIRSSSVKAAASGAVSLQPVTVFNSTGHRLDLPGIVSSAGIYVTAADGTLYTDLEAGVWCTSVGHRNERVNAALRAQMDAVGGA